MAARPPLFLQRRFAAPFATAFGGPVYASGQTRTRLTQQRRGHRPVQTRFAELGPASRSLCSLVFMRRSSISDLRPVVAHITNDIGRAALGTTAQISSSQAAATMIASRPHSKRRKACA